MADKRDKSFGSFGTGKPTLRRRSRWSIVAFYVVVAVLLLVAIPPLWRSSDSLYRTMVEATSPKIDFVDLPVGIGSSPLEIKVKVSDEHSGLDQVEVTIEQFRTSKSLLKKPYRRIQHEDLLQIPLDPQALGLREGEMQISVKAYDKSFWSNTITQRIKLEVDYKPPVIEVLSMQQNVLEGGIELVFYRLPSDPNAFSGVTVGSKLYPGFPAIALDPSFGAHPNVYFAFFAIPSGDSATTVPVRILSRDAVGNTSTAKFPYQVLGRPPARQRIKISRSELLKAVDQTYEEYLKFLAVHKNERSTEFYPTVRDEEILERFELVAKTFREQLEEVSQELFSRPKSERFWQGKFGRPFGRPSDARFGFIADWVVGETVIGSTLADELWHWSVAGREVYATNHGKVIFADTFGPFGLTVILDHGLGLSTLHTHLSSLGCTEGDELRKGQLVGLTGRSGLIPFSGSGYQFRLHGTPIRPEEWWDQSWLDGHIEKKIEDIQRLLGIPVVKPLAPDETAAEAGKYLE